MLNYLKNNRSTGYDAYRFYIVLKLHFDLSGSYDAIKYQFKSSSIKNSSFETHKHKFFFDRLAKKYTSHYNLVEFYVLNIIQGKLWIGEMNDKSFITKKSYLDSYGYKVQEEIKKMVEKSKANFDSLLVSKNSNEPLIFDMLSEGSVSLETVCCINLLTNFIDHLKNVKDPLGIFKEKTNLILKYQPFLSDIIDLKKIKERIIFEFTEGVNSV